MVPVGAGLGDGSVLHAVESVHDAGVFGAAILAGVALDTAPIISLVAYVITKIAVGIYAGGVVSATLLPDWNLTWSADDAR